VLICLLEAVKAVTVCRPGQPSIILGFLLKTDSERHSIFFFFSSLMVCHMLQKTRARQEAQRRRDLVRPTRAHSVPVMSSGPGPRVPHTPSTPSTRFSRALAGNASFMLVDNSSPAGVPSLQCRFPYSTAVTKLVNL